MRAHPGGIGTPSGAVPQWPTIIGTYKTLRKKLDDYPSTSDKIAALAYWDSLIHKDIDSLASTGTLPQL